MKIESVIYKNGDGVVETIELNDIANRPDYEIVKKNWSCGFENCTSRIEYVPKGKKSRILEHGRRIIILMIV